MRQTTWHQAVLAASVMGSTGKTILQLLAEHRVLELPMLVGCLGLHYATVREALGRLERRGLVYRRYVSKDPTMPSRWFLTAIGARTARILSPDPFWEPRPVSEKRSAHATLHDLALAALRLTIFRPHWRELVVQRGRHYAENGPIVEAQRLYHAELAAYDAAWSAEIHGPRPKEPEAVALARRSLGLPVTAPIPEARTVLIPDLYWPGSGQAPPVILEYEGRQTDSKAVWLKARHLAGYTYAHPARVVVIYPKHDVASAMRAVWRRVLRRLPEPLTLAISLTSMEALWDARHAVSGGLRLPEALPSPLSLSTP